MSMHVKPRNAGRLALAALFALLAAGALPALPERADAEDWRPVTLVYNGDVIGKIEPCG